jgi:hypothetical protein
MSTNTSFRTDPIDTSWVSYFAEVVDVAFVLEVRSDMSSSFMVVLEIYISVS